MSLNRSEKEAVISDVTSLAAKAQTLVLAEYRGITVADMTKLRTQARSSGVTLSVFKNTLARRAVAGGAFDVVSDQMTGPLIYSFSEDAVAAAKVVAEFAKTNEKLVIRCGAFGGKALSVDGVKQLANIPSKEVLLAQLLGLMMSPISRTARVLAALAEKRGVPEVAEAEVAVAEVVAAPAEASAPVEVAAAAAPAAEAPAAVEAAAAPTEAVAPAADAPAAASAE